MRITTAHRFNKMDGGDTFYITYEEAPKRGFYWWYMGKKHGPFKNAEAAVIDAKD